MLIGDIYRLTAGVLNSTGHETPINTTDKTLVIFTGEIFILVLMYLYLIASWVLMNQRISRVVDHADSTFMICTEDNLIQVPIYITVKLLLLKCLCHRWTWYPPPSYVSRGRGYSSSHHINNADVPVYLLMDFVMQKGMNLSQAS